MFEFLIVTLYSFKIFTFYSCFFCVLRRDNIKKVFHSLGKAVRQVKTRAEEVLNQEKKEESDSDEDYEIINEADKIVKVLVSFSNCNNSNKNEKLHV